MRFILVGNCKNGSKKFTYCKVFAFGALRFAELEIFESSPKFVVTNYLGVSMSAGAYVLMAVLLLSGGFGIYRKLSDGKLREEIVLPKQGLAEHLHLHHDHAPQVTFLQFSSQFCQPCRVTTKILDEVTNSFPDICHIELDVVEHLDLVKTYGINRTPTTLIIDNEGTVHFRAVGVPKKSEVVHAVAQLA